MTNTVFHKQHTGPRSWIVGSIEYMNRPTGFYFIPNGYFMDDQSRQYGPYASEEECETARVEWEDKMSEGD